MKKFIAFCRSLFRNNTFLKFLSIIIALATWLIIINVASPTKVNTYKNIVVNIDYENSTPARNGLIMLLSEDTPLTVDVTLQGQRAYLLTYSQDKIDVSLNLDSIAAPGTYSVPYDVVLSNSNLQVTDISPASTFVVEFAKKASKSISVETAYTGVPYSGYEVYEENLGKKEIVISGPENTVNSVDKAIVAFNLDGRYENISDSAPVQLVDASGKAVDTRFITYENGNTVDSEIKLARKIPFEIKLVNSYGGDESKYTSLVYSTAEVFVDGEFDTVSLLDSIVLDTVNLSEIRNSQTTKQYNLPIIDGITYLTDISSVSVDIYMSGTYTKTLNFTANDVAKFDSTNLPDSAEPTFSNGVSVAIRTLSDTEHLITRDSVKCTIDFAQKNAAGKYKLIITLPDGVSGGVLAEYYVAVKWQ